MEHNEVQSHPYKQEHTPLKLWHRQDTLGTAMLDWECSVRHAASNTTFELWK